jgi:hypothetical protein
MEPARLRGDGHAVQCGRGPPGGEPAAVRSLTAELNLTGGFWSFMGNFELNKAGFIIVAIFVLT